MYSTEKNDKEKKAVIQSLKKISKKSILEKRRTVGERTFFGVAFVIMAIYAFTLVFAFAWVVMSSFKDALEFADIERSAIALPEKWIVQNWLDVPKYLVVEKTDYIGMFFNSIWFTVGSVTLGTMSSTMVAYCLVKYDFPLKKAIQMTIIVTMIIPIVGALPAQYKMYKVVGVFDSPLIMLTYMGGIAGGSSLMMQAIFRGVSNAYAEAAKIDGAGHFTIFFKIMLPQVFPPLLASWVMGAIGTWNDFNSPLLFLPSFPTLSTGLYRYESQTTRMMNKPMYFAGVIISCLPVLTIFIIFQDTIMTKVTVGGLKG